MRSDSDPLAPVRAYFDGLNSSDLDAIVDVFAEDATAMLPNAPTASGRSAIADLYRSRLDTFRYGRILHVDDLRECGDLAVARCHTSGTLTRRVDETTMEAESRELFTVVRRGDGAWSIQHYMANQLVAIP